MAKPLGSLDPDQLEAAGGDPQPQAGDPTIDLPLVPPGSSAPASVETPTSQSSSVSLGTPQVYAQSAPIKRGKIDSAEQAVLDVPVKGRKRLTEQQAATDVQQESDIAAQKKSIGDYEAQSKELLAPLAVEQKKLYDQHQELVSYRETERARIEQGISAMDEMSKRIAAEQPHDIWAEAGLGTKIAAIALMGIGAVSQSLHGDKTNPVVDQIDAAIKRDLTMQRMRLDKDKEDYTNKNLLVNQMAQHFERNEHAQDAAYSTAWNGIIGRMEIAKQMLTAPQMRANLDRIIAEAHMKKALAEQRLEENVIGQDQRAKDAILHTEGQIAQTESKQGAIVGNLQARQATESRKAASMQVPGWKFPEGFKAGDQTVVNKLAEGEVTAKKVFGAMSRMVSELDKVKNPTDLLSSNAYREYQQAEAQLLEAARGPGFGNTGARFTEMMKKLEEQAFTPGTLGRMTPEESKKLIKRAQLNLLTNLREAFAEHGGQPSKHEYLGGE